MQLFATIVVPHHAKNVHIFNRAIYSIAIYSISVHIIEKSKNILFWFILGLLHARWIPIVFDGYIYGILAMYVAYLRRKRVASIDGSTICNDIRLQREPLQVLVNQGWMWTNLELPQNREPQILGSNITGIFFWAPPFSASVHSKYVNSVNLWIWTALLSYFIKFKPALSP